MVKTREHQTESSGVRNFSECFVTLPSLTNTESGNQIKCEDRGAYGG